MLRFYAEKFVGLSSYFSQIQFAIAQNATTTQEGFVEFIRRIDRAKTLCEEMKLNGTVKTLIRLRSHMDDGGKNWPMETSNLVGECVVRVREELEDRIFFQLDLDKVSFADPKWLLDSSIEVSFPSTIKEFQ